MASRTRSLIQDNALNVPFNVGVKPSLSKMQHGENLAGKKTETVKKQRRPLQELNCKNSENLVSTKQLDTGASKATKSFEVDKPKQERVKKDVGRRALGDLTNSSKVLPKDASSKKNNSLKIFSAKNGEVLPDPAPERCLHNHGECIKVQRRTMDMDYFLETVGFRMDSSTPIVTAKLPPLSTTSKIESSEKHLKDLDEIVVLEFGCRSPMSTASKLDSPIRHTSAEDLDVPEFGREWDSFNFSGFKVKDSPSR